jgi:hypothetical protein
LALVAIGVFAAVKPYTLWFPRWPKIPSIKVKPSASDLVVPSE